MADSVSSVSIIPADALAAFAARASAGIMLTKLPELYMSSTTRVDYGGILHAYKFNTIHKQYVNKSRWHETTFVCVMLYGEMFYTRV